ncbi:glycosyltransferase [Opitutus terrae]|uniref:Tetratricopeptide TPR_2 repeat protein n=1 Tax=Opitutus terrae (strain DSM 11246 / JCM 15787 / PB90-1) TaxID=452637 RepID=B1ZRQ5_OPITP|nr:glycosyltransferase [Opitutus terrae]ACB73748.1 Tetratricopeptide TPR_2 repeat protein [Opitutus terrae PB90-1]
MRVLFATGSPARYMAPPLLGDEQVNCGPDWTNEEVDGYYFSLATPVGEYDLATVAAQLDSDQPIDAVVCLVDAAWRNLPRNLAQFSCPKILLVADTHHLQQPISRMLEYATSEPFDRVVFLYDRHHATFFEHAGLRNLYWFPGLTFPHSDALVASSRQSMRERQIAFVGQAGGLHPRRTRMLDGLVDGGLPVARAVLSQTEGLQHYGRSSIGLNASLNGDLNLRIFEILSSGALLLTDWLSPAAGLGQVWAEGREMATYRSLPELVERARHYLGHPEEAARIAAAGATWFDQHFRSDQRRTLFQELVFNGTPPPLFPGLCRTTASSVHFSHGLVSAYECVQEMHRQRERVVVRCAPDVPAEICSLWTTLPRVEPATDPVAAVDLEVQSSDCFKLPAGTTASRILIWDIAGQVPKGVASQLAALKLVRSGEAEGFYVSGTARRPAAPTLGELQEARLLMERGQIAAALPLAQAAVRKNPRSVEVLAVLAELAFEAGHRSFLEKIIKDARAIAPLDPRVRALDEFLMPGRATRRVPRLLATGWAYFGLKEWARAGSCACEVLRSDPDQAEAHLLLGRSLMRSENIRDGLTSLQRATELAPSEAAAWRALAEAYAQIEDAAAALVAAERALEHGRDVDYRSHFLVAWAALTVTNHERARAVLAQILQAQPGNLRAKRWLLLAEGQANIPKGEISPSARIPPRAARDAYDLLVCGLEVNEHHGVGVLLKRFFPASHSFVTLRSRTQYKGEESFGAINMVAPSAGLSLNAIRRDLSLLLDGRRIRRILCVPYYLADFHHGYLARELTGAPLCTYVMDDQNVYTSNVPDSAAKRLFEASDLRLAISEEMTASYERKFGTTFHFAPPVLTSNADAVVNVWDRSTAPANRAAMLGNVWTFAQFERLRAFTRATGLTIDWFGSGPKAAWLGVDPLALANDGIHCAGFLPERDLIRRIATYPFVVIPSGMLDETEDNESFSRLSLPSRMLFVLTKTCTPMLVLGSPDTAAGRFVLRHGVGLCTSYRPDEAQRAIRRITEPDTRQRFLANARAVAPRYVLPDPEAWLWRSLSGRRVLPASWNAPVPDQNTAVRMAGAV